MSENWKFEEVKLQVHKVDRAADQNKNDLYYYYLKVRLSQKVTLLKIRINILIIQPQWRALGLSKDLNFLTRLF